jgi:hypothetical protein
VSPGVYWKDIPDDIAKEIYIVCFWLNAAAYEFFISFAL